MTVTDTDQLRYRFRGGETWREPWDDYRWLRDHDPVHRVDHPTQGTFWVLSRFDDVFDAVRDTAQAAAEELFERRAKVLAEQ